MKRILSACSLVAVLVPGYAEAASVYAGCAVPAMKAGHHTFYVDPVKGSKTGDGSVTKPWRTLAEVLDTTSGLVATKGHNARTFAKGDTSLVDVSPKGVIKPGDVIMLMSGNHGDVRILNNYNSDFITVMAAPGQTPLVSSMTVVSSAKWLFQGIKFQGLLPPGATGMTRLVSAGYGDWIGTTQDIVFDNNSFSSTDDASAWTPQQWLSKPYNYALYLAANSCTSATNNHVYNVLNGISAATPNTLIQGNTIERMSNDGIDVTSGNILIKSNLIKDGVNDAQVSQLHADAIQGWSTTTAGKINTNKNVVIDSNIISKSGSGKSSYLQGISIFDGVWDGLVISNNAVLVNTYQGIAVAGAISATIVNNTVVATDPNFATQISVSKGGVANSSVTIRNNISTVLVVGAKEFIADHNIAASRLVYVQSNGVNAYLASGSFNGSNKIIPSVMQGFVNIASNSDGSDLRLKSTSVAQSYGSAEGAPQTDIQGKQRKPTVSAGAYN